MEGNFEGSLKGIENVRVDVIPPPPGAGGDGEGQSHHFFLSSANIQLTGLGSYLRDDKTRRLYCSEISASFVLSQFEDIEPRMVTEVALNTPLVIPVRTPHGEDYSLRVTAVCANHCPGSVMFMFEKLDREENVET